MLEPRLELLRRAVVSSEVSFSISDPHAPDEPLVWVNPAFEATTGYRSADVLGTNCRFLQGPHTDPAAIERIRKGLREGGTISETVLNYRSDGTPFWNDLVISPIHDDDGRLTHHVGVQTDVTERVEADAQRNHALDIARSANARLAALAAVSSELSDNLDTGEATIDALPAVVARHFGGWAAAIGLDDRGAPTRVALARDGVAREFSASGDPAHADRTGARLRAALDGWLRGAGRGVLDTALSRLKVSSPLHASVRTAALSALAAAAGLTAAELVGEDGATFVVAPLTAKGATIGLLAMVRDGEDAFDTADLAAVADLGVRAGVAVDNARLYAREHDAALTLQRSLLPQLPVLPGFEVAATYQPAHGRAQVGGDWFDVLRLPDTLGIGVAVGDVMGHDLRAAAAMGQLRSVLRSYAWQGDGPADVVHRLDELVRGLGMASLATCAYAIVCEKGGEGDGCEVTYTLAGHPPPLIRHAGGGVERLDRALTSPIGVAGDHRVIPQASTQLPVGGYLVLYTDGLVERRHLDIDTSIDMLEATVRAAPVDCNAEQLCAHIVESLTGGGEDGLPTGGGDDRSRTGGGHDDDICVLVLRRLRPA